MLGKQSDKHLHWVIGISKYSHPTLALVTMSREQLTLNPRP